MHNEELNDLHFASYIDKVIKLKTDLLAGC
jgi:hypothetical protein